MEIGCGQVDRFPPPPLWGRLREIVSGLSLWVYRSKPRCHEVVFISRGGGAVRRVLASMSPQSPTPCRLACMIGDRIGFTPTRISEVSLTGNGGTKEWDQNAPFAELTSSLFFRIRRRAHGDERIISASSRFLVVMARRLLYKAPASHLGGSETLCASGLFARPKVVRKLDANELSKRSSAAHERAQKLDAADRRNRLLQYHFSKVDRGRRWNPASDWKDIAGPISTLPRSTRCHPLRET